MAHRIVVGIFCLTVMLLTTNTTASEQMPCLFGKNTLLWLVIVKHSVCVNMFWTTTSLIRPKRVHRIKIYESFWKIVPSSMNCLRVYNWHECMWLEATSLKRGSATDASMVNVFKKVFSILLFSIWSLCLLQYRLLLYLNCPGFSSWCLVDHLYTFQLIPIAEFISCGLLLDFKR